MACFVALSVLGCTKRGEMPKDGAPTAPLPRDDARLAELAGIEARGDVEAVTASDLGNRDVSIRRAAARALSRMGDVRAASKLLDSLADEDPEVVAWAAHGLGWLGDAEATDTRKLVGALVARSISLPDRASSPLDPAVAITRALARCGTKEAEETLVAWLSRPAPWKSAAALALGELASREGELMDATQSALLAAATGKEGAAGLDDALFALGKLARVEPSLRARLFETARARLATKNDSRLFAIRALGRATADAVPELARVLRNEGDFDPAERSEAARALARLGESGQRALAEALEAFLSKDDSLAALETDAFGPLLAMVEMLRGGYPQSREALRKIANMPIPKDAPALLARRLARLQRAAASAPSGDIDEARNAQTKEAGISEKPAKLVQKPIKLTFVTEAGSFSMTLEPALAPRAVTRLVELARAGRFDGATVPRVVPGAFLQLGMTEEGEAKRLPRESAPLAFEAFAVGLTGTGAGAERLFVTLARSPELDGHYARLGRADAAWATLAEGDVIERVIIEE